MKPTLIDSHAHLDFDHFHKDMENALERAREAGVTKIINIGTDLKQSEAAIILAESHPDIFATVGVHPDIAVKVDPEKIEVEFDRLIRSSRKVVAVGETGLDYHDVSLRDNKYKEEEVIEKQKKLFRVHISLAKKHNLPLVIHIRTNIDNRAFKDSIQILREENVTKGVVHCFSFGPSEAIEMIGMGFYVGLTGIITYKNAAEIQEAVKVLPLNKILVETDAPFLSPQLFRGERNEPAYLVEVAKKVAEIKNCSLEEVADQTTENAKKLFKI